MHRTSRNIRLLNIRNVPKIEPTNYISIASRDVKHFAEKSHLLRSFVYRFLQFRPMFGTTAFLWLKYSRLSGFCRIIFISRRLEALFLRAVPTKVTFLFKSCKIIRRNKIIAICSPTFRPFIFLVFCEAWTMAMVIS